MLDFLIMYYCSVWFGSILHLPIENQIEPVNFKKKKNKKNQFNHFFLFSIFSIEFWFFHQFGLVLNTPAFVDVNKKFIASANKNKMITFNFNKLIMLFLNIDAHLSKNNNIFYLTCFRGCKIILLLYV